MYDHSLATPSGPATIQIGLPPVSLLKFPPDELPHTLPAPHLAEPTWYQPFNIPPDLYAQLLDVRVPVTVASLYAVTVVLINRVNKRRGYKPYAFSQTRWFKAFVVLHNVFLAIYSAWTFAAMFRAFRNTFPNLEDGYGLAGVTDALCKPAGTRGYGNATVYNTSSDQWVPLSPQYELSEGVGPRDLLESERLWNQGLGFLGWIFYLSKFYEVFDTAIILAKGKKSSTLQTYHHTGAMMCMWAGIRYVAAPIWIFTLINSAIHAMMYTYYTLTAVRIRVPGVIKRSLTSMQITQFLFGTSMAASYLFVQYTLPVQSTPQSGPGSWLSRFGWKAQQQQKPIGLANIHQQLPGINYQMTTCLDTTGQAFAVMLNVSYLLPLTYLFVRFFVRSYLYRKDTPGTSTAPQPSAHIHAAEKAGLDALKGVSREIQKSVEMNGETSEATEDETVKAKTTATATAKAVSGNGTVNGNGVSAKPRAAAGPEPEPEPKPAKDSPIRTRSSAAKKATSARQAPDSGFSPVKNGTKKGGEVNASSGNGSTAETTNPYGVLGATS